MSNHNPSLPRTMDVVVGDEVITVRKLPLGKAVQLSLIIKSLPDVVAKVMDDEETLGALNSTMIAGQQGEGDMVALGEAMMKVLPNLFEGAIDFVVKLIAAGTERSAQWVEENVGIDEALRLIVAILTVNNVMGIVEEGKNLARLLGLNQMVQHQMVQQLTKSGSKTSSKSSKVTESASVNS